MAEREKDYGDRITVAENKVEDTCSSDSILYISTKP